LPNYAPSHLSCPIFSAKQPPFFHLPPTLLSLFHCLSLLFYTLLSYLFFVDRTCKNPKFRHSDPLLFHTSLLLHQETYLPLIPFLQKQNNHLDIFLHILCHLPLSRSRR